MFRSGVLPSTTLPARFLKGGGKLRSPVESIGPLAGLYLDTLGNNLDRFGLCEALAACESHNAGVSR